MRCILCKSVSDNSKSVEHVIPESLGNEAHVLPPGWVCDSCNNYVSVKIEKPFLDSLYGRHSRFEMRVPSKRGRVPPVTGLHAPTLSKVDLKWTPEDGLSIGAAEQASEAAWVRSIIERETGTIYIPSSGFPRRCYETSRFIAKIAIEVLAYYWLSFEGGNDEIVDKPELDELRNYVRRGRPGFVWPVFSRRIYPQEHVFLDPDGQPYEVLHEFKILPVRSEYYVVIAIFGIEFTINLGGPELDGFHRWLKENENRSPLH